MHAICAATSMQTYTCITVHSVHKRANRAAVRTRNIIARLSDGWVVRTQHAFAGLEGGHVQLLRFRVLSLYMLRHMHALTHTCIHLIKHECAHARTHVFLNICQNERDKDRRQNGDTVYRIINTLIRSAPSFGHRSRTCA